MGPEEVVQPEHSLCLGRQPTTISKVAGEKKAETVLAVLRAHFRHVGKGIEETIRSMTDPTALDSWAVHTATCQSLGEFDKAIHD